MLAVLPVLAALVSEPWLTGARPTRGDQAIIEIHLRQALHGRHLLGPYSQYGWFHPGPLFYYLLAPLYVLSGGATGSLYFAAGIINLAALAGAAGVHFKLDRTSRGRAAWCLLLTASVAAFVARVPEGAFVANPLTEIWNPAITVLPFALLLVTGAAVASGRLGFLPLLTFLHAFTAQTHISYVPPSTAVLLLALGAGLHSRRVAATGSRSAWRRPLALSGAVAFLVWLPPVIAALRGQAGNALDVLAFFVSDPHEHLGTGAGLALALRELHWPLLTLLRVEGGRATALAALLSAAQLVGAGAAWRPPFRKEQPYVAGLALIVTVATLVAIVQATQLMSANRGVYYYQTLYYCVLGCLGWGSGVLVLTRALSSGRLLGALASVLVALAVASELVALGVVKRDFERCLSGRPRGPEPGSLVAAAVKPLFDGTLAKPRYELDAVTPDAWGVLAPTVLQLSKVGVTARLAKRWRAMLGSGADYQEHSSATVQIALGPLHKAPLWQAFADVGLYLPERPDEESRGDPALACRVLASAGVTGDPDRLCDGKAATTGARPSLRSAVKLKGPSAEVTVLLPSVGPGELVVGVELDADGNDAYLVEASEDLRTYVRVGVSEPVNRRGARWREFYFNDRVAWKALRLSPSRAGGNLVEVQPLVRKGSLTERFPWAVPR